MASGRVEDISNRPGMRDRERKKGGKGSSRENGSAGREISMWTTGARSRSAGSVNWARSDEQKGDEGERKVRTEEGSEVLMDH
jgi:hypothetical protein